MGHGLKLFSLAAAIWLAGCLTRTMAHEHWADGTAVPSWIRRACCGVADVHRLTVGQIRHVEGGWLIEGYNYLVPDDRVAPSQDEFVWIFYRSFGDGIQSRPFCVFIPQGMI
jgi:hypothetical protein